MLKAGGEALEKQLIKLFTKVWHEERIPKNWEKNIIMPVYKQGDSSKCENYRGVCLSSVALKAFSRIIEARLRMTIEGGPEEEQAAFRPGRQTQDPICSIRTICDKFIERGKEVNLALLDLKAAFDTVPRVEIWNALARKNVPSKLIRVIKAMYERVEGVVRLDGKLSNAFLMERGVRQRGSLSPLLFISFMDEVLKICKRRTERTSVGYRNMRPVYCQALLYADDIVLIADSEEKLQGAVIEWTEI
jgi:hypothetical protein